MKKIYTAIGFLFLFSFAAIYQMAAQETVQMPNAQVNERILKEILSEVKQLRSTLVKTGVNQMRFQTTFEQYKSQQIRVDSMKRELDTVKNQLSATQFRANTEDIIKQTEERLNQTTDPRQRQNMERQLQSYKRSVEMQEQRDKRSKERQTDLEMQIPLEQAKLDNLNFEIERIKQDINQLLSQ